MDTKYAYHLSWHSDTSEGKYAFINFIYTVQFFKCVACEGMGGLCNGSSIMPV